MNRLRTPLQVGFQQILCFGVPLLFYIAMDNLGIDVTGTVYLVVVVALALTALTIVAESVAAMKRVEPPPLEDGAPPPASAIIAAYLPNEAETVVETVEAFLRQDYPDLQIVLAYNTPRSLPVEAELREIAARDPRFEPLRVEGSASKAQNVNAALARVRGEFVGIFDADHHPAPGSFLRAWRWLASEADVVQGHCVVRNGSEKGLTRLVAAEFEAMYAVTHPGRARLHGFGIFGGSNGYWRREMIERTRMRSFMLTEDIDSSLRVLRAGGRIVSDRGLVSTELAPDRVAALWNQRMRWAQGWSQVALRHLRAALRSPELTLRQRLGCLHLLGWRELFPGLRRHDAAHLQRRPGAGMGGVAAVAPVRGPAQVVVRLLRAGLPALLRGVQERDGADRPHQGGDARAQVEGDAARGLLCQGSRRDRIPRRPGHHRDRDGVSLSRAAGVRRASS